MDSWDRHRFVIALVAFTVASVLGDYSYQDVDRWSEAVSTCEGRRQSPINIVSGDAEFMDDLDGISLLEVRHTHGEEDAPEAAAQHLLDTTTFRFARHFSPTPAPTPQPAAVSSTVVNNAATSPGVATPTPVAAAVSDEDAGDEAAEAEEHHDDATDGHEEEHDEPGADGQASQDEVPEEAHQESQGEVPEEEHQESQDEVPEEEHQESHDEVPEEEHQESQDEVPEEEHQESQDEVPEEEHQESQDQVPVEEHQDEPDTNHMYGNGIESEARHSDEHYSEDAEAHHSDDDGHSEHDAGQEEHDEGHHSDDDGHSEHDAGQDEHDDVHNEHDAGQDEHDDGQDEHDGEQDEHDGVHGEHDEHGAGHDDTDNTEVNELERESEDGEANHENHETMESRDAGIVLAARRADVPAADSMLISNNGHTAGVKLNQDIYLVGGGLGDIYKAAQLHFHWGSTDDQGSEHTLDGRAYPIEMHVVTFDSQRYSSAIEAMDGFNSLAVLGVFFEISEEDNPALTPITDMLDQVINAGTRLAMEDMDVNALLPENRQNFFRYEGSLTTPPCFQSVIWTVFQEPQTISETQLEKFRQLHLTAANDSAESDDEAGEEEGDAAAYLVDNFRPVQALNGRRVYSSFVPAQRSSSYRVAGSSDDPNSANSLSMALTVILAAIMTVFINFNRIRI